MKIFTLLVVIAVVAASCGSSGDGEGQVRPVSALCAETVELDVAEDGYIDRFASGIAQLERDDLVKAASEFIQARSFLAAMSLRLACEPELQLREHGRDAFESLEASDDCAKALAWLNPVFLYTDSLQITGNVEVDDVGLGIESDCVAAYPFEEFGIWLPDYGAGRLIQLQLPEHLVGMIDVLSGQERLGIGLCSIVDFALASEAGVDDFTCCAGATQASAASGSTRDTLFRLGVNSWGPAPAGAFGSSGVGAHDFVYTGPTEFFGQEATDLLAKESRWMSACGRNNEAGGDDNPGFDVGGGLLEINGGCLISPSQSDIIMTCSKPFLDGRQPLPSAVMPPLIAPGCLVGATGGDPPPYYDGVDPPENGNASENGTDDEDESDTHMDQKDLDVAENMARRRASRDGGPSLTQGESKSASRDSANGAEIWRKSEKDFNKEFRDLHPKKKLSDKQLSEFASTVGISKKSGNYVILIREGLDREMTVIKHERTHIYLLERGIPEHSTPKEDVDSRHHWATERIGLGSMPLPNDDGLGGSCFDTPEQRRAVAMVRCVQDANSPPRPDPLDPYIYPPGPEIPAASVCLMQQTYEEAESYDPLTPLTIPREEEIQEYLSGGGWGDIWDARNTPLTIPVQEP